ncbi:Dps family protein [Dyadobacter sp. 3J3]|uniref:Dps family protein n=1 Tax=Dyadobacter sp. 3J3 TaxID=2606600 RepID=UPI0013593BE2|nr:DNA starvation/stationary phase protection protein [Dyadobacter sp. 3J3]
MTTETGITENNSQAVANDLLRLLADENVLYIKTRNAGWNLEDASFYDKERIFVDQAVEVNEIIDKVARRIRAIGHYAFATLESFLALTHLSETKGDQNDSQTYLKDLLADHDSIIIHCREDIHRFTNQYKDAGTSDFIAAIMEQHENMAWTLRAHLKGLQHVIVTND